MGKSEIRLRKQVLNPLEIERHRDYQGLMKRHEQINRRKRFLKFFTFSLLITLMVILFLIIVSYLWFRVEKKNEDRERKGVQVSISVDCEITG